MSFGIWNNLDELALYMGLERLSYETDEALYNRIKQFAIYKYKTDYYTQVHSIPLQLGLQTYDAMRIYCRYLDPVTSEVIEIPFECRIDWEFITFENFPPDDLVHLKEYIRVFINNNDATLEKVLNLLDSSVTFQYNILKGKYKRLPCKFLVRNTNIGNARDFINTKYTKLTHGDIVPGSLTPEDTITLKKSKASLLDMTRDGDYYVDNKLGYLQLYGEAQIGFFVTYQYYKPYFSFEGTEMNLVPLNILAKYGMTDQLLELSKIILEDKVWGN